VSLLSPTAVSLSMHVYRCYFLDSEDHIKAAENIEAEALTKAIERALALLELRPQHRAIEIWEGERRVFPAG
jgi:hypothetical protein